MCCLEKKRGLSCHAYKIRMKYAPVFALPAPAWDCPNRQLGAGKRAAVNMEKRAPPGTDVAGYVRRTSALWLSAYISQEYSRKESVRGKKMNKGLIHLYTGEGKGKTTAAMGLAPAARSREKVLILQFMKGRDTGNCTASRIPAIRILRSEKDFGFFSSMSRRIRKP